MRIPIKIALLGFPVRHSRSPIIHNHWMEKHQIEGIYEAHEIHPDRFTKERVQGFVSQGYVGFNLTLPLKEPAMEICDSLSDEARAIGAVNTIVVREGQLHGHNTDAFGFFEALREKFAVYKVSEAPVMILGAGGAARAAVYILLQEGAPEIRLYNRTLNRAEALIANFGAQGSKIKAGDWQRRNAGGSGVSLVVNTTSLGMKRHEPLLMDFRQFSQEAIAYDMVYEPLETRFLKDASAAGLKLLSGIHMLAQQARQGFKLWFDVLPEIDDVLMQKVLMK